MNGPIPGEDMPAPAGMVAVQLPPAAARVIDPSGQHRLFRTPQHGIRTGANLCAGQAWTLCVEMHGRTYVVPSTWVHLTGPAPTATILNFPPRGRFADQAQL